MIISREYIGTQTVAEAFVPIISEDIRKKIAEGDTFDNEGAVRLECTQWNMKTVRTDMEVLQYGRNKNGEQDL